MADYALRDIVLVQLVYGENALLLSRGFHVKHIPYGVEHVVVARSGVPRFYGGARVALNPNWTAPIVVNQRRSTTIECLKGCQLGTSRRREVSRLIPLAVAHAVNFDPKHAVFLFTHQLVDCCGVTVDHILNRCSFQRTDVVAVFCVNVVYDLSHHGWVSRSQRHTLTLQRLSNQPSTLCGNDRRSRFIIGWRTFELTHRQEMFVRIILGAQPIELAVLVSIEFLIHHLDKCAVAGAVDWVKNIRQGVCLSAKRLDCFLVIPSFYRILLLEFVKLRAVSSQFWLVVVGVVFVELRHVSVVAGNGGVCCGCGCIAWICVVCGYSIGVFGFEAVLFCYPPFKLGGNRVVLVRLIILCLDVVVYFGCGYICGLVRFGG